MADLRVTVDGLTLPNPFVIGSGPPGTNANVIGKAFDEGWGAVICKTVSLDSSKVINVQPRYGRLRAESGEIIGWENIELISDRPFATWIDEFKRIKDRYPDRILVASIMEEYRKEAWVEIVERCQAAGVDAFELNFSCPHGLPERRMGWLQWPDGARGKLPIGKEIHNRAARSLPDDGIQRLWQHRAGARRIRPSHNRRAARDGLYFWRCRP